MSCACTTDEFDAWYGGLQDRVARGWIRRRINRLLEGNAGSHRVLGGRLRELKIHWGPGYRVYYAQHQDLFLLLCGGDKRTQTADIAHARRLLKLLE